MPQVVAKPVRTKIGRLEIFGTWPPMVLSRVLRGVETMINAQFCPPVNDASKRKENEENEDEMPAKGAKLDLKKERKRGEMNASNRKGDNGIDDLKTAKRARTHQRKGQEGARTNSPLRGRPLCALVRKTGSVAIDNWSVRSKKRMVQRCPKRYPIRLGVFVQSVD
ncbi:hypothetical protein B0H19DRAFT_1067214 [Mycena capillaripes]|nr:hypothetical protein B0H19DRAFT_1067214 [Mycena capillaripes]